MRTGTVAKRLTRRSAKPLFEGSNPSRATQIVYKRARVLELVYRHGLKPCGVSPCGFKSHPGHTKSQIPRSAG